LTPSTARLNISAPFLYLSKAGTLANFKIPAISMDLYLSPVLGSSLI